ncbi:MAG TPA: tetratricopeptide repeat protein [Lacunisphaera sp.]|jgi:HemY protein
MAKKIKRHHTAPVVLPPAPAASGRRRWLGVAGLIIVFVTLGFGAMIAWHWYRLPERVQNALPVTPDFTGKPAILPELVAKATALSRTRGHALDGVEELGKLYHVNGYRTEAEACWQLLHREQPRDARWVYFQADLRRAASDYDSVASLLAETVKLAPDYSPAWLWLANLELKTGQLDIAENDFKQRLALVPKDPHAILGLARVAQQRGQNDTARKLVEQLVQDAPQLSTGHNLYAEILSAAGDTDGARKQRWLGRETERFREPDDPWLDGLNAWCYDFTRLCVLAVIEGQTERGDKGKGLIERAMKLEPDNPIGYELLGKFYRKAGQLEKARETFEEGLRVAKNYKPSPMYYVNLSEVYRQLKQPEKALQIVEHGLAENKDQLELYDALGVALADLNRQEEAVAAFRAALTHSPNDSNSNYNLGMSLLMLGRQDEAHEAFKRSLILQPTFMKALSLLGRWELEAGHLDAAGEYLKPLYESHPELPEARQMLARWHLLSGQLAEKKNDLTSAEAHYRAASTLDPGRTEIQVTLGIFYLVHGRVNDALAPLEAFHKLQPNDPQSSLFLGQVYAQLGRVEEAKRILVEGEQLATRAGQTTTAAHFREMLQGM